MEPILTSTEAGVRADEALIVQKPGVVYVLNGKVEAGANTDNLWSNEPANELAFILPAEHAVVNSLLITELDRTLLFLAGKTGQSQIGFVRHNLQPEVYGNINTVTDTELQSAPIVIPATTAGLYEILLNAPCLEFSRYLELSVRYQFKNQDLYLYLADGKHADRIIRFIVDADNNLSLHTDSQRILSYDECNAPIYVNELDCARARLDALADTLTLEAVSVQNGGTWEAGALRFFAAYSTNTGERLTEFLTSTGNVSIWDNAIQTRSGEASGKSVRLRLSNSSTSYTHVVIGVLQTIGTQSVAYTLPPYALTGKQIVVRGDEPRIPSALTDLLEARTHYEHSKGLAVTEDRLLRWGLEEKTIPNLQKYLTDIVTQWRTIQLPEAAYADGIVAEKFRGYMRDEVVALGIVFEYDDGDETGVYHLPGRAATAVDLVPVTNADADAIVQVDKRGLKPVRTWEVYNTAVKNSQLNIGYTSVDEPGAWESGDMAYWESAETYPNRPDVWGELCGQPIRHHKMPDSSVTHIHSGFTTGTTTLPLQKTGNFIYPLGITVYPTSVLSAIQQAEVDGVIAPGRIKRYRIVRADRAGNASILGRGLLYNVNKYERAGKTIWYANYPLNDLRPDVLLTADKETYKSFNKPGIPLPFTPSPRFTLHSPDFSFTQGGRGDFLQLETEEFGQMEGQYVEAEAEAKQQLPSGALNGVALDAVVEGRSFFTKFTSGPLDPLDLLKAISESEVYKNLLQATIPFVNYGLTFNGVGWYNQYRPAPAKGSRVRAVNQQALLQSEIQQVAGDIVNNRFREKSVYVTTKGTTLPVPQVIESSRYLASDVAEIGTVVNRPVASFYGTIKRYLPAQYGQLASIAYLETGHASIALQQELPQHIFGGDTFINRFSLKRKHQFFTQNQFGLAPNSSVNLSLLPNVAFPIYFYDKDKTAIDLSVPSGNVLSAILSTVKLNQDPQHVRLVRDRSTFLYHRGHVNTYSYGIPYFFCESAINLDMRQANDLQEGGFYPLVDPGTWTQQQTVSIERDNQYVYDKAYSHALKENKLLSYPDSQQYNQLRDRIHDNRVIYSEPGNWRYFKALNSYDFDRQQGPLISLDGLDGDRVLARFEDGASVFNAYSTLPTDKELVQVGNGGMFTTRPQEFLRADGGLLGAQHRTFIQTPFGYCWVDQKRGAVYLLPPGSAPQPLQTGSVEHWLQDNLRSHLSSAFPTLPALYFPVRLVYDALGKRLIVTKRDYYVKKEGLQYDAARDVFLHNADIVTAGHPDWFEFCGWTMTYHFPSKQWSFASYVPDQLLSWPNGFMSVLNPQAAAQKGSGWIHRNSRLQYQRFFGKLYPFELEIWTGNSAQYTRLDSVQWDTEVRRYHQKDQHVVLNKLTYDTLNVATDRQTTDVIALQAKEFNDMRDLLDSKPRLNQNVGGSWSVNQINDRTKQDNTLPIQLTDRSNVRHYLNQLALRQQDNIMTSSPIAGTGYTIRFSQHTKDRYQFIHRWVKPTLAP